MAQNYSAFHINPEEFVQRLYEILLRRHPDEHGLAYYSNLMRETGDPTLVFDAFLQSGEYKRQELRGALMEEEAGRIFAFSVRHPVYFLHIPKTAGTSAVKWLYRMYSFTTCPWNIWDDLIGLQPDQLQRYNLFTGHFGGGFDTFLGRPVNVVTLMRDPVTRTLSHYKHVHRDPSHPHHRRVSKQTLDEFVVDQENRYMIDNFQSRYIAELPFSPKELLLKMEKKAHARGAVSIFFEQAKQLLSLDYIRQSAFRNLSEMKVVGATESIGVFFRRFESCFGLDEATLPSTPTENVSENWRNLDVSPSTIDTIKSLTILDQELYERFAVGSSAANVL